MTIFTLRVFVKTDFRKHFMTGGWDVQNTVWGQMQLNKASFYSWTESATRMTEFYSEQKGFAAANQNAATGKSLWWECGCTTICCCMPPHVTLLSLSCGSYLSLAGIHLQKYIQTQDRKLIWHPPPEIFFSRGRLGFILSPTIYMMLMLYNTPVLHSVTMSPINNGVQQSCKKTWSPFVEKRQESLNYYCNQACRLWLPNKCFKIVCFYHEIC